MGNVFILSIISVTLSLISFFWNLYFILREKEQKTEGRLLAIEGALTELMVVHYKNEKWSANDVSEIRRRVLERSPPHHKMGIGRTAKMTYLQTSDSYLAYVEDRLRKDEGKGEGEAL